MPTIYLDCDGVLADFDAGAVRAFGMTPEDFEHPFGLPRFWSRLASVDDFFGELPLLPDVMRFYEAVREPHPVWTGQAA